MNGFWLINTKKVVVKPILSQRAGHIIHSDIVVSSKLNSLLFISESGKKKKVISILVLQKVFGLAL